jgi:hypothetical protein
MMTGIRIRLGPMRYGNEPLRSGRDREGLTFIRENKIVCSYKADQQWNPWHIPQRALRSGVWPELSVHLPDCVDVCGLLQSYNTIRPNQTHELTVEAEVLLTERLKSWY